MGSVEPTGRESPSALLAEAHAQYTIRNPESARLHVESSSHLPGGNTRTVIYSHPFPLVVESGDGPLLKSVDGQTYTDFLNEYSAGIFGHSCPRIRDAIQEALDKGWNYGAHNRYEKILAATITERFGKAGVDLVRFTNSGTEANTMAVAVAMHVTKRKKVLVFTGGYHGATISFPSGSGDPSDSIAANLPHEWAVAPFNNIKETRTIINSLPPRTLAAILIEPIQGAGGCRPASRDFLTFLRRVANEHEAVFIVDEVMTSRLGRHGFLAKMDLRADILTLGKYIGGGMTMGAFGGRKDIMSVLDPARGRMSHAGTFNNNVLSMAAGIAGLAIYDGDKVDALNALGDSLRHELQTVLIEAGISRSAYAGHHLDLLEVDSFEGPTKVVGPDDKAIKELPRILVTGHGSMLNIRFFGADSAVLSALLYHHMLKNGIFIATRGYITLSLELTETHITTLVKVFRSFVREHQRWLLQEEVK